MHDSDRNQVSQGSEPAADSIARLLRLAGPRPAVAAEREDRVRAAVHIEWQQQSRARKAKARRRFGFWVSGTIAAAAAVIFAITQVTLPGVARNPAIEVARVDSVFGVVRGPNTSDLLPGATLFSGTVVATAADSRAALRLGSGHSVRLDHNTHLRLETADQLVLEKGAVYVESSLTGSVRKPVRVGTQWGDISEIGTQFEVRIIPGSTLRVRVREGSVELEHPGGSQSASAGTELNLAFDGSLTRRQIALWGPEWRWVLEIAPSFNIEGASLSAFLGWVVRETGWQLRFADDQGLSGSPDTVVLHGSLPGLPPDQAPTAVLPTCGLDFEIRDGVLIIGPPRQDE